MKFTKKKLVWGMLVPLSVFAVALAVIAFPYAPAKTIEAAGGSGCEGDVKIEGSTGTIVAPEFMSITSVCIKAGRNVFTFGPSDTDKKGCYVLEWGGGCYNKQVTISGGGTGRDCKAVSHFAVTFGPKTCIKA